ncbi:Katanin p80 WD40 repeat-containing subunit B1 homolog KTN80.4 [Linum perenne]
MTTKRAYKLQEFVAHSSAVNCLKIGRKSSRLLVTGGEDHKVNLWSIGKPNALLSLSGHTSGIDSVGFDSSEVLVAAGAASGTIKLWDLEEAKIVRTLTGHRSNCISVDFHPFGEFFASGSLDTNLKIWDIRKKGCIHTYKGHTRGVNAIRFTPDGRWVVSGGEDNTVKLWDLTAGKLLHDFKCHEGQIQCIDFHPHEFLLATGSADKTVKFFDLETFELIGSSSPEASGVRCLTFNPDGRNILCGFHESLKVFSWEPIRCHDTVDVGWSRLSDLHVNEGKLLGCSYNQSCVGVWVVDISRIEPYALGNSQRFSSHVETKASAAGNQSLLTEKTAKSSLGRITVSQGADSLVNETKSLGRLSVSSNSDTTKDLPKESKILAPVGSVPGTPQKVSLNTGVKALTNSTTFPSTAVSKKSYVKANPAASGPVFSKAEVIPVIVPRTSARLEHSSDLRKETSISGRSMPFPVQSKTTDFRRFPSSSEDMDQPTISAQPGPLGTNVVDRTHFPAAKRSIHGVLATERSMKDDRLIASRRQESSFLADLPTTYPDETYENRGHKFRDVPPNESQKGGRIRPLVLNMGKNGRSNYQGPTSDVSPGRASMVVLPRNRREYTSSPEAEMVLGTDEDYIADVMELHGQFVSSMQSRLAKLQAVYRYWERNDVKGAISAMEKMADHAVLADVTSIITERIDIVTLDICTFLLPVLTCLLESKMDRHLSISMDLLLKLVRTFGTMIYTTVSAATTVGVDIEAERRLERCNLCFVELEKVKRCLSTFTRRGGSVGKSAQELNLALQEVS